MKKRFNITGVCFPEEHYIMDNSAKLARIMELVEQGQYFTINRPRQYGKTTMLYFLMEQLKTSDGYIPVSLNFQGVDRKWHQSDDAFARMFARELHQFFEFSFPEIARFTKEQLAEVSDMGGLSWLITRLANKFDKKLVLLIDEVDASSSYEPFLSFLGMLRTKYLARNQPHHRTFHSIVLAGVHDVKNLKFKLRNPEQGQYNSPWNIAIDFDVDMRFNPSEITPMLEEYRNAEEVEMDIPAIAERLHYHTSGYPFLVSRLCKIIAENILPERERKKWTLDDVEESVQRLLRENNTNFDSLIKNLENNAKLYDLVYQIIIDGENLPFNPDEPLISQGKTYGIFKANGNGLKIHNRIYEQRIYNYMTTKTIVNLNKTQNYSLHFTTDDKGLDMRAILLKFQQFMKEQYAQKDKDFYERQGRVIFLAFLTPILNGQGHTFREVQASEEKRLDVVVTYFQHRYIIELKRWYGGTYHQKGIGQLAGYLQSHNASKGYLVIFDDRKEKSWEVQTIRHDDKEIFAVWV